MPLDVPAPIQEFLAQLDARGEPIDDDQTIPIARPADGSDWPSEQQRGAYAEVVRMRAAIAIAWQFVQPGERALQLLQKFHVRPVQRCPWGSCPRPCGAPALRPPAMPVPASVWDRRQPEISRNALF